MSILTTILAVIGAIAILAVAAAIIAKVVYTRRVIKIIEAEIEGALDRVRRNRGCKAE